MRLAPTWAIVLVCISVPPLSADAPPSIVPARTDHNGDPLPTGVVARFGTTRFRTHSGIHEVALSPDGSILAERVERDSIYFFETATGRFLQCVQFKLRERADNQHPVAMTFRPDGQSLLYAVREELDLHEIDLRTWQVRRVELPKETICLTLTPDTRFALLGRNLPDKMVRLELFDLRAMKMMRAIGRVPARPGDESMVALSPSGRYLVIDATVPNEPGHQFEIRDLQTGTVERSRSFEGPCDRFAFNAAESELFVMTRKGVIRFDLLWTRPTKINFKAYYAYPFEQGADCFVLSPDERYLLMSGMEGVISIWDMQNHRLIRNWNTRSFGITDLDFTRDGKTLITSSEYECIPRFWDYETATDRNPRRGHRDRISSLQFDPSGKELISASDDGSIRIWNLEPMRVPTGNRPRSPVEERYRGVEKQILCETIAVFNGMWLTDDGKKLYAFKGDEGIIGWERSSGKRGTLRVAIPQNDSRPLVLSPDGKFLAGIQEGNGLRLLAVAGEPARGGDGETKYASVGFHPDGKTLLALTQGGECECWDLVEGKRVRTGKLLDPDQPLKERYLCLGSESGTAIVWNRTTGRAVSEVRFGNDQWTFSPNGRYIAAVGGNLFTLLDAMTGQEMTWHRDRKSLSQLTCLRFAPDTQRIALGYRDGLIELFDLRPPRTVAEPTEDTLAKAWDQLLDSDLVEVRKAMGVFLSAPSKSFPWLSKKIVFPKALDLNAVSTLLDRLDDPKFRNREQAMKRLRAYGDTIEPRLDAMEANPRSAEVGYRCRALLKSLEKVAVEGDRLRLLRAIEILEADGSDEAKRLLEKSFATDDRFLRLAARDALERLKR